jgi:glyoxalase family protein
MISGLHHVTAIADDPQRNVDFYTGVLGLRLVKKTVNFDAPEMYHLYYGDEIGRPGTLITFFSWPGALRGRHGAGQATVTSFSIPSGSVAFWVDRLRSRRIPFEQPARRFDEEAIALTDHDGLQLELVAGRSGDAREPWAAGPVPAEHAVRGVAAVTLSEQGYESTASVLQDALEFHSTKNEGNRYRYQRPGDAAGATVDVLCVPDAPFGRVSVGTVHHVAFRTPSRKTQETHRLAIAGAGLNVTPVLDRQYFESIYFREPGGVLFEIATDPPGFTLDEPPESLGTALKLPPWLEPHRRELERALPPLTVDPRCTPP